MKNLVARVFRFFGLYFYSRIDDRVKIEFPSGIKIDWSRDYYEHTKQAARKYKVDIEEIIRSGY